MRLLLMALAVVSICAPACALTVTVFNPTQDSWEEVPVIVTLKDDLHIFRSAVDEQGNRRPVQVDTINNGLEAVFLAKVAAGETRTYKLEADAGDTSSPKRAHTGMYLKGPGMKGFEGPGWENELIAFRIYWDKRNATDVFCKTEPILSLEAYARPGLDYHRKSKYGMDVLKVGNALGIGGFGVIDGAEISKVSDAKRDFHVIADGPLRSVCDLIYTDWTTTSGRRLALTVREIMYAGQTWGESELTLKATDGKQLPELVGGIVHHAVATVVRNDSAGLIGTWGKQALGEGEVPNSNNLGLGIMAEPAALAGMEVDKLNVYLRLKAPEGKASFRYLANWEFQPDAAKSAEEFQKILEQANRKRPVVKVVD